MRITTNREFQTPGRSPQAETDTQWATSMQAFFDRGNQIRIGDVAFGKAEFDQLLRTPSADRPALARQLLGQPNLDYNDFRRCIDDVANAASTRSQRTFTISREEATRQGIIDARRDHFDVQYGRRGSMSLRDTPTTLERFRSDALGVMNTQPAQFIDVNGVRLSVQGASPRELESIRHTLSRLPASHLRTLPPIVVADTVAHGNRLSGGGFVSQVEADSLMRHSPATAFDLRRLGWADRARLELTHASLSENKVGRRNVSFALLHETGHAVDARYHVTRSMTPDSLGDVVYDGNHQGDDPRGPVSERFGDAYMKFWGGSSLDPIARATIEAAMQQIADTEVPAS